MYIGRYRVEVIVNHKGEQTKFLLWDRECAELIGQSVDEVNRLKIAVCYCIIMQCFFSLQSKFVRLLSIFIVHIKSSIFFPKDGDVDLNASPQALDRVLGCFLAFKVKVQSRFRNVVVLKYSDELDLINVVLDMLPDTEVVFCQVCFSCCHSIDIFHLFLYSQFIYHAAMLQDQEFNARLDRPYKA